MKVSIVIPVYNAEKTITPLVETVVRDLYVNRLEMVLVNDCSHDQSHAACLALQKKYPAVITYLNLSKNFGEHNAVMAGLNHTTGDYVVIMDDDFQNPPTEVEKLVDACVANDHDVVYGVYLKKKHNLFRNLGSWFNSYVATLLIRKPRQLYLSSFKCINRFTVNEIIKYQGPFPYIDGLIFRVTANAGEVMVEHDCRTVGTSNYNCRRLVRLWLHMFVNFSVMPLRVSMLLGVLLTFTGMMLTIMFMVMMWADMGHPWPPGWPSIYVSVTIFSGTQLITLGLLGEYLGRLFLVSNNTPQYVVRASNCRDTKKPE